MREIILLLALCRVGVAEKVCHWSAISLQPNNVFFVYFLELKWTGKTKLSNKCIFFPSVSLCSTNHGDGQVFESTSSTLSKGSPDPTSLHWDKCDWSVLCCVPAPRQRGRAIGHTLRGLKSSITEPWETPTPWHRVARCHRLPWEQLN